MIDRTLDGSHNARRIDRLLAEYGESHQNPLNKAIHWIAVPVIAWTVLALLSEVSAPAAFRPAWLVNWATLAALLATLYYFTLSIPLALGMAVFSVLSFVVMGLCRAAIPLPLWQLALAVFVVAWVFQFIGHKVEGKKPSFFKDIQFLLIGPAWLLHYIYRLFGVRY